MAAQLKSRESAIQGVKRLIRRQLAHALHDKDDNRQEHIHSLRQHTKKVRAYLRLIRDGLDRKAYRRENEAFQSIARPLADVRDAQVILQAFDRIPHEEYFATDREAASIRTVLEARWNSLQKKVEHEAVVENAIRAIRRSRRRVDTWPSDDDGWSIIGKGIRRVYRAAYYARERADDNPSVENLHEWRKQTKYLCNQIQILKPIAQSELKTFASDLDDLADHLGNIRDLYLLRSAIVDRFETFEIVRANLTRCIDQRMSGICQVALNTGRQVFERDPKPLLRRFKAWWKHWHHD